MPKIYLLNICSAEFVKIFIDSFKVESVQHCFFGTKCLLTLLHTIYLFSINFISKLGIYLLYFVKAANIVYIFCFVIQLPLLVLDNDMNVHFNRKKLTILWSLLCIGWIRILFVFLLPNSRSLKS